MVKPINTDAIAQATGVAWPEWCAHLDAAEAAKQDHNAIVKLARAYKPISGWWAQGIAVAYEQHIGRRLPGQTSDGLFSASVSRTLTGDMRDIYATWCGFAADLGAIGDSALADAPTTSETPKRLYWRCKCVDDSTASLGIEAKAPNKSLIAIEHRKLQTHAQIDNVKTAWRDLLDRCFG